MVEIDSPTEKRGLLVKARNMSPSLMGKQYRLDVGQSQGQELRITRFPLVRVLVIVFRVSAGEQSDGDQARWLAVCVSVNSSSGGRRSFFSRSPIIASFIRDVRLPRTG